MKRKLLIISLVMAILCMMCPIFSATAEETTGSLTLWCVKDEDIIEGMHWQIYKVGYRSGDDYVFTGDFADYRVTLGNRNLPMLEWDTETVARAGETLKNYAIVDNIPYIESGKTDKQGKITFDGLENGLYLVVGKRLTVGDTTYVPSAIFFEMRGEDESALNAYPKIILKTLNAQDANYVVKKVWQNDENQPWARATTITADVYRDGVLYKELELNEANEWTASWTDTQIHEYIVIEKDIPDGYTVSYEDNTWQYLIVNTYEGTQTTETTTTATTTSHTETTTTTVSTTSDTGTNTSQSSTESSTTNTTVKTTASVTNATTPNQTTVVTTDKLPQTGQTWWPVFPLTLAGMSLIGIGFTLRKRNKEDDT